MQKDRFISLIVLAVWVVAALVAPVPGDGGGHPLNRFAGHFVSLLALGLIWFGDELGEFTGVLRGGYISKTSPGWMVKTFGWLLLFFLIGVWIYAVVASQMGG